MSAAAIGLSLGSLVWSAVTVVAYFRTIPQGKVPVAIGGLVVKLFSGIGLAAFAVALGVGNASLNAAVIGPAALAVMMASGVLYLLTLRKTPVGDLRVKTGEALLPFAATTAEGIRFHTEELAGKRTLLKFFRGGW